MSEETDNVRIVAAEEIYINEGVMTNDEDEDDENEAYSEDEDEDSEEARDRENEEITKEKNKKLGINTENYEAVLKSVDEDYKNIDIRLDSVRIPANSIILCFSSNQTDYNFYLLDCLNEQESIYDFIRQHVSNIPHARYALFFDKNLNPLTLIEKRRESSVLTTKYTRIHPDLGRVNNDYNPYVNENKINYIVLSKEILINSKGKDLGIIAKNQISDSKINVIQQIIQSEFEEMEKNIKRLRESLSSIYNEEDYEIIYKLIPDRATPSEQHRFLIHLLHHDITITNSIEQSHFIGDITTNVQGHFKLDKLFINTSLRGRRLTFNFNEYVIGFHHSHLSCLPGSGDKSRDFCLGSSNHMFSGVIVNESYGDVAINDLEFESILLGIEEYVAWESLEGGPHFKIEMLGVDGAPYRYDNGMKFVYRVTSGMAYHQELLNLFKEYKEVLKNAFNLTMVNNIPTFTLDDSKLLLLMHHNIPKAEVKRILIKHNAKLFFYNEETKSFNKPATSMTAEQKHKKIEDELKMLSPIYIDGKFINTSVAVSETLVSDFEGPAIFFDPVEITLIARTFVYKLNKQLENEYRNN
jgi:hypothetical protein